MKIRTMLVAGNQTYHRRLSVGDGGHFIANDDHPEIQIGHVVTVEFDPADQFARIKPEGDDEKAALDACFAAMRVVQDERAAAALLAVPALQRLCAVFQGRSGQAGKLRSLLFSLYNGRPADLSDILCLDWALRQDLAAVMLGFGFENARVKFFYTAFQETITSAGQWDWFVEASRRMPGSP